MSPPTTVRANIRKATAHDLEAITDFITPFVESGKLLPRTVDELGDLVNSLFIAELDGRLVGCAALEIYSKKLAEIRSLAVAPEMQGTGVGRKLVAECLALAQERHVLEVMAISSSEAFFKACGFDFTLPGEKKAFSYKHAKLSKKLSNRIQTASVPGSVSSKHGLCYTAPMDEKQDWIERVRSRDLTVPMHLMLDALEPLGPLGAQILWGIQPIAGLWGGRGAIAEIAEALEAPNGLDKLRQRLDDPPA